MNGVCKELVMEISLPSQNQKYALLSVNSEAEKLTKHRQETLHAITEALHDDTYFTCLALKKAILVFSDRC